MRPAPELPSGDGLRARGRRGGLVLVVVVCLAVLVVTVWLDTRAAASGPGIELAPEPSWPYALNGVALALLAGTILVRSPRQPFGWLLGLFGVFWALDGLAQAYVRAGLHGDDAWAGMTFVLWFYNRVGAFLPVSITALLLVFPDGRFLPGRWGVVGRVTLGLSVAAGCVTIVVPAEGSLIESAPAEVDLDPTTLEVLRGHGEQVLAGATAASAVALLVTMLLVVVRYRSSRGVVRDRMRWLLWSVVVMAAVVALTTVTRLPGTDYLLTSVVMVLPGAAMTIAVVRPEVVPITDLLGRTLVLATVLVVLVAADAVVLAGLALLLDDGLDDRQIVAVVLVVAVVLYGPLRQRLSSAVRRRMLGDRDNPYDALAGLSSTLEVTDDAAEQLAVVARAVAAAFGVRFVGLEVDWSSGDRMVTTYGDRPAEVQTLPITYRGGTVGRLVLPARGVRSRLTGRDERLLGDLVRQAATAVRTSRLADELQDSRERLVITREEERRRIRRDLHDGLGPALSGLVYQLESVRLLVDRDPAAAKDRINAASAQLQEVVADVRRLVHDLRPPALDDRGLVGALSQLAEHLSDGGPATTVEAGELGGLPAAVEVAAYRIAAEALTNVARHARATTCTVRLRLDDGALVVEVADDGRGIPADAESGVGLVSLRERAAELGGRSEVVCPDRGGTVVRAWLPLRMEP